MTVYHFLLIALIVIMNCAKITGAGLSHGDIQNTEMRSYSGSINGLAKEFNQSLPKIHQQTTTSYMLELYNALQKKDIRHLRYGKRAISKSDTIRSLSAVLSGKYII